MNESSGVALVVCELLVAMTGTLGAAVPGEVWGCEGEAKSIWTAGTGVCAVCVPICAGSFVEAFRIAVELLWEGCVKTSSLESGMTGSSLPSSIRGGSDMV